MKLNPKLITVMKYQQCQHIYKLKSLGEKKLRGKSLIGLSNS